MTTVYLADTGAFVRCGGPDNNRFQRLRRAVRQARISLRIPQRFYEELGGDPAANEYPSGAFRIRRDSRKVGSLSPTISTTSFKERERESPALQGRYESDYFGTTTVAAQSGVSFRAHFHSGLRVNRYLHALYWFDEGCCSNKDEM